MQVKIENGEGFQFSWSQWELLAFVWYILLIVLLSVLHKLGKRTILQNLKGILTKSKSALLGVAVLEWCLLTLVLNTDQEAEFLGKFVVGGIAFVAVAILSVHLYWNYCSIKRFKQDLLLQQSILLREQETIKSYYDRDAKRLHDMKHVLLYLYRCVEEQDLEKAKTYLENYTKEVAEHQKKIWTGLTEIDFSANYYYQLMQEKGISFSIEADVQESPLEDLEMMIVLGNLLENAMTAAEQCLPGKRKVYLKMKNANEMFFLRIENSSTQLPKRVNGRFLTSKTESVYHGLGIENVRQIVEKRGGTIQFTYTDSDFYVEVIFFGAG